MAKTAILPNGTRVEFPDDTTQEEMAQVLNASDTKSAVEPGSYIDNIARRVASGLSFGFADEFAAKMNEATGRGDYASNVEAERARDKAFFESNPVAATTAEIGGAIANPINSILPGAGLPQYARYGLQGAALGALAGAGNATEGNRIEGGTLGGLFGLAGGVALPAIVQGVSKGVQSVADRFRGPISRGMGALERAMVRDNLTVDAARARLNQLGPESTIADLGGNVRGLSESIVNMPGKAVAAFENMTARQYGAASRVKQAALDAVGAESIEQLIAQRAARAQPLYDDVLKPENVLNVRGMGSQAQDLLKMAVSAVKNHKIIGPTLRDMDDFSMPVVNEAKKYIDDLISVAQRQGQKNEARILTEAKGTIMERAGHQFPKYKLALEEWGGPSDTIEAMQLIDKIASKANDGADLAKRMFGNPEARATLQKLFPDDESFKAFAATMAREKVFSETARIGGNSRTQFRNAAQADLQGDGMDAAMQLAQNPTMGQAVASGAQAVRRAFTAPPVAVADELAPFMFSADPNVQNTAFDMLRRRVAMGTMLRPIGQQTMTGISRTGAYGGGLLSGSNQ